ncbi:protein of unknown function [Paraburkholderia kururiensis]|uniref:hypothetical protein n=1 Tax=Paraburkholderia kururiensis TaxID=984307 RepID=UPI0039A77B3B
MLAHNPAKMGDVSGDGSSVIELYGVSDAVKFRTLQLQQFNPLCVGYPTAQFIMDGCGKLGNAPGNNATHGFVTHVRIKTVLARLAVHCERS